MIGTMLLLLVLSAMIVIWWPRRPVGAPPPWGHGPRAKFGSPPKQRRHDVGADLPGCPCADCLERLYTMPAHDEGNSR